MRIERESANKERNQAIGESDILVTKDLLPGNNGYRLSFVDLENGLLRENRSRTFDKRHFIPFPDWVEIYDHSHGPEGEVKLIYATAEGLEMINELGYGFFRSRVFDPEAYGGREYGRGSESIIYKVNLVGKECVIKLANKEAIKRLQDSYGPKALFLYPDYLKKFGKTRKVSRAIKAIEEIKPFESFELKPSPIEYVAGRGFLIEEFKQGSNLLRVVDFVRKGKEDKEKQNLNWQLWAERVWKFMEVDKKRLDDLFFLVGQVYGGYFRSVDFNPQDWVIRGVNEDTGKLKLSLLDQASSGIAYAGSWQDVQEMIEDARKERLEKELANDPSYKKLQEIAEETL